jgi:tetratricopeptide (TPR) repeat protein
MLGLLLGALSSGAAAATCEPWVARVVAVEGLAQARRAGQAQWQPVSAGDVFCEGDTLRVQARSRAAVVLRNDVNLRLDQLSTVTFVALERERTSWLDLLTGAAYFFSRMPRSLRVTTPFVNAAVEGTEFLVSVAAEQTWLSVFEGLVAATNAAGSLSLASGQSAAARRGEAPAPRVIARPRDAVQWALYYPPVLEYRPADFADGDAADWRALVRRSIQFYRQGNLAQAFASLADVPEDLRDPRFFAYRAGLLLSVGRVDEAAADIDRALRLDARHAPALAVRAVIAVVHGEKAEALRLARSALALDPTSPAAWVALSYAQQAAFDLKAALVSLREAVRHAPENALAWARLAEIQLSLGDLDRALQAAQTAVRRHPDLARTQTVLGFAHLAQIDTRRATEAFARAIQLDQADPLPRLGWGLAAIREGNLEAGRAAIEIAVSLDPNAALARSYLGKAYSEEKRDALAGAQLAMAKQLDPQDPTPWFYDAIRKQSLNRPAEALRDLQRSIALNDNRAVYRSRLLLDDDLAARGASLARIYHELGFQQLALVEGWKSLDVDPTNHSAHRFLADAYLALPRHEIARVSELLQSQLLQPINIAPVQPQLAESQLFILSGAGPAEPALSEFNPLFTRNRLALLASGVGGGNRTLGDEVVVSGVWHRLSYSLGQFHYETDGFRANNDLQHDLYNAFTQVSLSPRTSLLAEYRSTFTDKGDLSLRFDPSNFLPTLRQTERLHVGRLGVRHALSPRSAIIAVGSYLSADFDSDVFPGFDLTTDEAGYMAELRHLFQAERWHLTGGVGQFSADRRLVVKRAPQPPSAQESDIQHRNLYVYASLNHPPAVVWTLGGSADFFEATIDRQQFNPKVGVTWQPAPATTLRAAVFRALRRTLIASQTLEPTQVAGFNQFFDDPDGTASWRYGIGVDQRFSAALYGGVELSRRDLRVPFRDLRLGGQVREAEWEEQLGRAYLYWTPHPWLALSLEYQYERFERDPDAPGTEGIARLDTHRLPLGLGFFHPAGFRARLRGSYIVQGGRLENAEGQFVSGDDRFFVVDASIGYRLPKRWGLISLEARNLFDQRFRFQDTDPANPAIYPERLILARFTLAY